VSYSVDDCQPTILLENQMSHVVGDSCLATIIKEEKRTSCDGSCSTPTTNKITDNITNSTNSSQITSSNQRLFDSPTTVIKENNRNPTNNTSNNYQSNINELLTWLLHARSCDECVSKKCIKMKVSDIYMYTYIYIILSFSVSSSLIYIQYINI
jgi:hypothetical protein